jgi:16S rRNA (guanine(966)-N(2))-methyltransferase RsmD
MRIVSGDFKGRVINVPASFKLRPTTDVAKESLFNILVNRLYFDELSVLDLFSGTGNITYEFASRGASQLTSVELEAKHVAFIAKTCAELGRKDIRVIRADAFAFLRTCNTQFDLIFADPPYELPGIETIPGIVFERQLLKPGGMMIIEHAIETNLSASPFMTEKRKWGKVNMSFFENKL